MISRATADPRVNVTDRAAILPKPDASKRKFDRRTPTGEHEFCSPGRAYVHPVQNLSLRLDSDFCWIRMTIRLEPPYRSATPRARVISSTSSSRAPTTDRRSRTLQPTGKDRLAATTRSASTPASSRIVKPRRMDGRYLSRLGAGMLPYANPLYSFKSLPVRSPVSCNGGPVGKVRAAPPPSNGSRRCASRPAE